MHRLAFRISGVNRNVLFAGKGQQLPIETVELADWGACVEHSAAADNGRGCGFKLGAGHAGKGRRADHMLTQRAHNLIVCVVFKQNPGGKGNLTPLQCPEMGNAAPVSRNDKDLRRALRAG